MVEGSLGKRKRKEKLDSLSRSRREVEVGIEKSFGRKIFYHINFLKFVILSNIYLEVLINDFKC